MDPSAIPGPPPDPAVSRPKGTSVDSLHAAEALEARAARVRDAASRIGGTLMRKTMADFEAAEPGPIVSIWSAETAAPTADAPVSRVRRPRNSDGSTDAVTAITVSTPEKKSETDQLKIEQNVVLLRNLKAATGASFANVLSGNIESHSAPKEHAPIDRAAAELRRLGIEAKKAKLPEHVLSLVGNTGGNVFQAADKPPKTKSMDDLFDNYKFYLSLGSKTGDVAQLGHQERFLIDLVKTAVERGIDISWKTMDHDYDQPCVYSSNPAELGQLLGELYQSDAYPKSMWNDAERFFQGEVKGTSNKHIGMVQEPKNGFRAESHSGRMRELGKLLEASGDITPETYAEAIKKSGLRPEAPGLLSAEARTEYYATVEARRETARKVYKGNRE